jgi:hypothetical protein
MVNKKILSVIGEKDKATLQSNETSPEYQIIKNILVRKKSSYETIDSTFVSCLNFVVTRLIRELVKRKLVFYTKITKEVQKNNQKLKKSFK